MKNLLLIGLGGGLLYHLYKAHHDKKVVKQAVNDANLAQIGGAAVYACPIATQNIQVNTKNRNIAIESPRIQYGPLNLKDNKYWKRLAKFWNTTEDVAKASRCSNCAAFDISPRMKQCMPGSVQKDGELGYCWMHDFKCHSARTCYTWAAGGPIDTNKVSYEWQQNKLDKGETV